METNKKGCKFLIFGLHESCEKKFYVQNVNHPLSPILLCKKYFAFIIGLAEKLLLLLEIIISNVHNSKGINASHLYCFISNFFPQVTQLFLQLFTVF